MTRLELERALEGLHSSSFGWALVCCRWDRAEAEDVLQSAYVKAIEGRARFNGHASPRTWFFGVVRHIAAGRRRSRAIRGRALSRWRRLEPAAPPPPSPEGVSGQADACRRVRRLLLRLSARQREVLHLVFYQDLSIHEAAGVLRIPLGTARKHYARGKARMRSLLEEDRR